MSSHVGRLERDKAARSSRAALVTPTGVATDSLLLLGGISGGGGNAGGNRNSKVGKVDNFVDNFVEEEEDYDLTEHFVHLFYDRKLSVYHCPVLGSNTVFERPERVDVIYNRLRSLPYFKSEQIKIEIESNFCRPPLLSLNSFSFAVLHQVFSLSSEAWTLSCSAGRPFVKSTPSLT